MKISPAHLIVSVLAIVLFWTGAVPGALAVVERRAQDTGQRAEIDTRRVTIWSDGTRLSGDLFYPRGLKPESKLPALVLCHGWGGVREHLNRAYAPSFAAAGYVVLTFDYRGWGDSDSRLVMREVMPKPDEKGEVTVSAQAVREVVDPFDQTQDIESAVDFISGEPGVDPSRIGLWGTSYGGGHVVYVAANDARVKCVVAQVASMDSASVGDHPAYSGGRSRAERERVQRARGEGGIAPVPQGVDRFPNLRGTPYVSRMIKYRPIEHASRLAAPILIIDVENEELFDIRAHGGLVYQRVEGRIPAKYHVFPGLKHYDIYTRAREEAIGMAVNWYDRYLKGNQKD